MRRISFRTNVRVNNNGMIMIRKMVALHGHMRGGGKTPSRDQETKQMTSIAQGIERNSHLSFFTCDKAFGLQASGVFCVSYH